MNISALDFTNYREHPSDNRYQIFFYKTANEAKYFMQLLNDNKIKFDYHEDANEPTYQYYFAVNKIDMNVVKNLNYLAIGKYRKPIIGNNILRILLFIVMITVMSLGIIGYIKSH